MMVTVLVRYFGILAGHAGRRNETVQVPRGSTVTGLLRHLAQANSGSLGTVLMSRDALSPLVQVLHNQRPLDDASIQDELADGDEILFLPVVSGGC